jgi:hypothetical protein
MRSVSATDDAAGPFPDKLTTIFPIANFKPAGIIHHPTALSNTTARPTLPCCPVSVFSLDLTQQ